MRTTDTSRRRFLTQVGATVGAFTLAGTARSATGAAPISAEDVPPSTWFPRQDPKLVQEVVGLAHHDLDGVRALVGKRPELAKAQWDWGYGDWESPLDAASHTGRREIALFLLEHGARPTIFSAAMLGQLAVVQAFVAAAPGVQAIPGPHGIPLLVHAEMGGTEAAAVVAYLKQLGGAGGGPQGAALADAEIERYLGTYRYGPGAEDLLEVTKGRFGMAIARQGGMPRGLTPLGDHAFHPAGAPSVRVRFDVAGERARAVSIHDPDLLVRARR